MTEHDRVSILMLSCREASRLVSEGLDRELTRRERWALWIHTRLCSPCRKMARQLRSLHVLTTRLGAEARRALGASSASLSAERREAIKARLREVQQRGQQ